MIGNAIALDVSEPLGAHGLDIHRRPRHPQTIGDATGITDQSGRIRRLADADKHPLARRPRSGDRVRPHMRQ